MWLQGINKVKVTHQGQGQIKVIFKERYSHAGGLHLNQMRSCTRLMVTAVIGKKSGN